MTSQLETVALTEWRVTFTMAPGKAGRVFVFTISATDEQAALDGAYQIAGGIDEASGHIWKLTGQFTAEAVAQ